MAPMSTDEYDARSKRDSDLAHNTAEQQLDNNRQADGMAQLFTSQWLGELDRTREMYDSANTSVNDLSDFNTRLNDEYDSYTQRFGGLLDNLITETGVDLENRRVLADSFMQLATPDLDGAGNRAMAGVAHQSALAEQQIQRGMTRGGGNPASSNYTGMLRQNALDTARNKVLAGTTARNQEREVGLRSAATGISLFDPNVTGGLSLQIQGGANDMLDRVGENTATVANLRTGIASGYSQNITDPLGSAAGAWGGMAYGQGQGAAAPTSGGGMSRTVYTTGDGRETDLAGALAHPLSGFSN